MSEVRFVSADWLADNLDDVRVVDVRDAWEYDSIGHVPGAVNVPFDAFRTEDGAEGMMPPADEWITLVEEAGIRADDTLVAYDDTHGVFAARFLVTALYFGHGGLALLDGDYSAWIRGHEATTERLDVERTRYDPEFASENPFVDADTVLDAIDDPEAVVVDTREPEEFAAGHLPGAVNLDWKELVDQETRGLKARSEVESLLADRGITPETRVVLYCNTARRISHTFVVLRHLGYEDVAFYEGSLTDWAERGHPVE